MSIFLAVLLTLISFVFASCGRSQPSETPVQALPTPTETPTPVPTPSKTPTPLPTETPTPSKTPRPVPTKTPTFVPPPTLTPIPLPVVTPTPTPPPTPVPTPVPREAFLEYTVTIDHPQTHLARVSLTMSNFRQRQIHLTVSVGSIGGYAKPFIKEVAITSKPGSIVKGPLRRGVNWELVVNTEGASSLTLDYTLEQLITDPHGQYESYIGEDFALIDASTMFLYPRRVKTKSLIHFLGPENWTASSVWKELGRNLFSLDNPGALNNFVAFGPFNRHAGKIDNLKAMVCVHKEVESRIDVEEAFRVIGDLTGYYSQAFKPLDKTALLWIVVSSPIKGGGVRKESFLLSGFRMAGFWHLLAHEYVHLWNGKGVHSPTWFREGATDFLAYKGLADTGVIPLKERNDRLLRDWQTYLNLRKKGQDKPPAALRVGADPRLLYGKGQLVTHALDLTIQDITKGSKAFPDITRYLAANYWDIRLSNDDLLEAVNQAIAADLSDFFWQYIYGTEELPLQIVDDTLVLKK